MEALLIMLAIALLTIALIAAIVAILRWTLRINHMIALQEEMLAHLQRINMNTQRTPD